MHAYYMQMTNPDHPVLPTGDLRRDALIRLVDSTRAMRTYADQIARDHGTTLTQWRALKQIAARDGLNQTELAEILEIQPISLVRLLDRMAAQGLVERREDPRDRRAKLLHATERGRRLIDEISPLAHVIADAVTAGLDDAEVGLLNTLLDRLGRNCRRAMTDRQTSGAAPLISTIDEISDDE